MRNTVSFYKQYRRPARVSRSAGTAAGLLLLAAAATLIWPNPATCQPAAGVAPGPFRAPGRPSAPLARLFTPRHAAPGAYEVVVLDGTIERARAVVAAAAEPAAAEGRPGPSPVLEMDPLMAFGEAGTYEKTTVARLYAGRKAKVVRIPVERDGRTVAAVTLVSPYPDATLSRLVEGTMGIVLYIGAR